MDDCGVSPCLPYLDRDGSVIHFVSLAMAYVMNMQDDTPEDIVEHLAELGFHPEDNDPEDDGLDEILKDAPSTPPNYYGGHPGCKVTVHKPKPR